MPTTITIAAGCPLLRPKDTTFNSGHVDPNAHSAARLPSLDPSLIAMTSYRRPTRLTALLSRSTR